MSRRREASSGANCFWPLRVNDAELDYTEYAVCLERKKNLRLVSEFFHLAESITQNAVP